jgi:ferrochelatase
VKRYLKEFLSDTRVIEIPAIVWQVILRGIILNTRPKKSAAAYSKVWTDRGSPLLAITQDQAAGLQRRLGDAVIVRHAMRYGSPSIPAGLDSLHKAGCDRILLAPLYPQYCAATTATAVDKAAETLGQMRWQPALRTLPAYHDDPVHIDALEADITRQLAALDFDPEVLLLSFHGMPLRTLHLGDPYHCQCRKTARLLGERLAARPEYAGLRIETTFQSRFGRAQWLEPATDDTLVAEGERGTKRLAVAAPGFSADCVETLEELAIEGRDEFLEAGGEQYGVLSCLNTSDPGMAMLEAIIRRELAGWI